ncbi:MAG: sulfate adenylyltransferase [Candidatus Marinimicrobia bacterium]|nr:sulfate adenylyltransferase [Candidatus Neomarinimicrobiota bacterium]MCF7829716.1 sulfate adenylyltransferase [Candidatus Neomarinimicrobiota bacterium]MCF7881666.1 sulfate adenylyltransferase [Candidatus Neomarinimicrobiota bacterium]
MSVQTIAPHGGTLVNRVMPAGEADNERERAKSLPQILLDAREMADLDMISIGAMSPLTGFMDQEDYESVVESMRLKSGDVWSLPITLSVTEEKKEELGGESEAALVDESTGATVGSISIEDIYSYDKEREAANVFRTTHRDHPGVQALYDQGDFLVGGDITLFEKIDHETFQHHRHTPAELRELFTERGWNSVVAFQTRNPIHRAHEYLQKCALELVDGLLVHPLVGETKSDDVPASVRMECYETILGEYYPQDRSQISVFPAAMRYAGPREAIFHALVRKNYGCTHFIVGRDHAGVGDYYGTYDAQLIFGEFEPSEIGITPMFFEHAFYCRKCQQMASDKTCPHSGKDRVFLSGTKVREKLSNGEDLPEEFTRPEVAEILKKAYTS